MNELDRSDNAADMNELDKKIRQYYTGITLSAERLDKITQSDHQSRKRRTVLSLGLAACAAGLAGSLTGTYWYRQGSVTERTRSTMRELALNHVAELSMEYGVNSINEVNQRMQLLSFSASLPERLSLPVDILGARYCTVSGNLAVHLKLFDQTARRSVSLFMTPVFKDLEAIDGEGNNIDGVHITLWQEKNMFYAMAY